jgi:transcriptional antiterminator RfaH
MTVLPSGQRWYVVQTQSQREAKAAGHLRRQGFHVYAPSYLKRRRHARRVETVARPLFPGYLFVAIDICTQRWRCIHSTVGVSRLLCHGDVPAPVPHELIASIEAREDAQGHIRLQERARFAAGDKVRIADGAFAACDGLFESIVDEERVAILLDLLGRKVRLVVDGDLVAAA